MKRKPQLVGVDLHALPKRVVGLLKKYRHRTNLTVLRHQIYEKGRGGFIPKIRIRK